MVRTSSDDGGPICIFGKTEENFREVVPELVEEAAEGEFLVCRPVNSQDFKDFISHSESTNYITRKWHAWRYRIHTYQLSYPENSSFIT